MQNVHNKSVESNLQAKNGLRSGLKGAFFSVQMALSEYHFLKIDQNRFQLPYRDF